MWTVQERGVDISKDIIHPENLKLIKLTAQTEFRSHSKSKRKMLRVVRGCLIFFLNHLSFCVIECVIEKMRRERGAPLTFPTRDKGQLG